MRSPQIWIMKITPDEPLRTKEIFNGLFMGSIPKNVIGWSGEDNGRFKTFMDNWLAMKIGDIVVIMEGTSQSVGAVVITSEPFESDEGSEDWFKYRRKARLIRKFDTPIKHEKSTNRDRILKYSGGNAIKIMDEVWDSIKDDYSKVLKELLTMEYLDKHLSLLDSFHQIVLTGPPGTGKTYLSKRIAARLLEISPDEVNKEEKGMSNEFNELNFASLKDNNSSMEKGAWTLVQFHPSYNYEDFIRGIKIDTSSGSSLPEYKTVNQIFVDLAECAAECWSDWKNNNPDKDPLKPDELCAKFILIIDEINRANLPSVFGELIYGLEYRGSKVRIPYGIKKGNEYNELIMVPPNLYIIGTMNTADKSVGHIDYAVRRRFVFDSVLPDRRVIENYYKNNEQIKDKALELFDAVSKLFEEDGHLAHDFYTDDVCVGHTYFLADDNEELYQKFIYQVYPLLREYYKDGILIPKVQNDGLSLHLSDQSIFIDQPEKVESIMMKLQN